MARKIRSKEIMSQEQLAEIGSIALESTECEVTVESILWALAGLDKERGPLFTQNMQMNARLELLSSLGKARLADGPLLDEFSSIISTLKELNSKRNNVIHGSWGAWITIKELLSQRGTSLNIVPKAIKRRPNKAPTELSAKELSGLPEQISQTTDALINFVKRAWPSLQ